MEASPQSDGGKAACGAVFHVWSVGNSAPDCALDEERMREPRGVGAPRGGRVGSLFPESLNGLPQLYMLESWCGQEAIGTVPERLALGNA